MNRQPTLENPQILLRPLCPDDAETLWQAASDPLIWEQHPNKERATRPGFDAFFQEALESEGAFLIVEKASGQTLGSTRFTNFEEALSVVEIGWTFFIRSHWATPTNRAVKTLMLDYAFQFVDNVVFRVHQDNFRSRRAVEKLGGELLPPEHPLHAYREIAEYVCFLLTREKWQGR